MNVRQRELQTVQLTYQRDGRVPLTVREMETGYTHTNFTALEQAQNAIDDAHTSITQIVKSQCEQIDALKREIAWLSAKLDTYERPHDMVRCN